MNRMSPFFPRHTATFAVQEMSRVVRFAQTLPAMAVMTGVVVHLYTWVVLATGPRGWFLILLTYAGRFIILLGLATVHLGNHTVRSWAWRAPLFVVIEGIAEAVVSAALIALGVERLGTDLAHWSDWPAIAYETLLYHAIALLSFTVVLAAVVQVVRYALLRHEHRASTAMAIHEEHVRHEHDDEAGA